MSKTRRRLRRTAIIGLEIVAGATLGFLVLMGAMIWRLSEGPISISFLSETIAGALSAPERGIVVEIASTELTWAGWQRGLDIQLVDVKARDDSGRVIAEVGNMTVAFSLQALAAGELSPTRLEVIGPSIFLTYGADGRVSVGRGGADMSSEAEVAEDEELLSLIVGELMRAPEDDRQLGGLRSFEVRDANLVVYDELHGVTWETPGANMIMRRDANGLNVEAALAVKLADEVTFFDISGYFDRGGGSVQLSVGFDRIIPALLADQSPYLSDLATFDLPVSGLVNTVLHPGGADFDLRLDVAFEDAVGSVSAQGAFSLADELVTLDAEVRHLVLADLAVRLPWLAPFAGFDVVVDGQSQLVVGPTGVDSAGFVFRSGSGTVTLPDQFAEPLAVASVTLEGAMAGGGDALDIGNADIEFGTSRFVGAASAFADGQGGYEISVDGTLYDLAIADTGRYWPSGLADGARQWVADRIPAGDFTQVEVDLYGRLDIGRYSYEPLETRIEFAFQDISLLYIEEMPPLTGMNGTGSYDGSSLTVEVAAGARTFDLEAGVGRVLIDNLAEEVPRARIFATLSGDLRNHFRMLDHEPLAFLDGYGIAPDAVSGSGTVDIELAFDLLDEVNLEAIQISVRGGLSGATLPNMVAGKTLTGASLQVVADNAAMRIEGSGEVNGTAVQLTREERFLGGDYAAQSTVSGTFDTGTLAELGLDVGEWLTGAAGLSTRVTEYRNDTQRVEAALDLSAAAIEVGALAWSKAPGAPASAELSLTLQGGVPVALERFAIEAEGLSAAGRMQFGPGGAFQSADLQSLSVHRTQVAGRIEAAANGVLAVRLDRGVLDLQPLLDDEEEADDASRTRVIDVAANLDRIWISDDGFLSQVSGAMQLVGPTWFSGQIDAATSAGAPVMLSLEPTDTGRFLRLTTSDAGSMLRDLGLISSVRDGRMVLSARFRDREPGRPLVGDLDISDFRLVDAPLLARVVGIAGVTGILDALQGAGIGFGQLATTFRFDDGLIEFREGRMVGPSLGITFEGEVDIDQDIVALQGAVAPAYALNGILGGIPLIGDVLVGGEGEGIFAVTYQASGSAGNPQVAVNPLSALTPGVLRNIFPGG